MKNCSLLEDSLGSDLRSSHLLGLQQGGASRLAEDTEDVPYGMICVRPAQEV